MHLIGKALGAKHLTHLGICLGHVGHVKYQNTFVKLLQESFHYFFHVLILQVL